MIKLEKLTIDFLKKNNERLYYFGLGFIQLKLNEEFRLHFYHPELEILVDHPHNHRYNFQSTILKGELTNTIYQAIKGNKYHLQEDSCSQGYQSTKEPQLLDFKVISEITYQKDQSYFMNHKVFHSVKANNCISLLKRGPYQKELAEISYIQEKICPFSHKKEESILWEIIQEMID